MEIITIDSEVWKHLNERLKFIEDYINHQTTQKENYDDLWLNNHEVCEYLHISSRTLARMRKKGDITYSKIHGQYFYTLGSINKMFQTRRVQSNEEYLQNLTEKGKQYVEKGRHFKAHH